MAVVWDEIYDPLDSADLGPQEVFDQQGHHISIYHHHYHHHQWPHSQFNKTGSQHTVENETNTTTTAENPWTPPSTIRETKLAYYIDVEVPGVVDMNAFKFQWLNLHSLMVEAKATPSPLAHRERETNGNANGEEESEAKNAAGQTNSKSKSDVDNSGVLYHCPETNEDSKTRIVLEERRLGSWRRSFTLPVDVDMKTAQAGVKFGLLHISILKKNNASDSVVEL